MKINHKVNHGWARPSAPLTPEYEAEVTETLRKAESAWRAAQKAAEVTALAEARKPSPATRRALAQARAALAKRLADLHALEAQISDRRNAP